MGNNSFMENMAADWSPKNNNWNWFFADSDKDGVPNGMDCQPYNKKKQDSFPHLGSSNQLIVPQSIQYIPSPFKPQQVNIQQLQNDISSGKIKISTTPQSVPAPYINYTIDTNKPYIIDSKSDIRDMKGNMVQPIFNTKIINGHGGGLSNYVRKDLPPNAVNAIQKGYNEKAVETAYDLNPLYASNDAKNIAAAAAQNYATQHRITIYEPDVPDPAAIINKDKNIVQGGYWNSGQNKIYISPENRQADRNATLIHEVEHSMQNPSNVNYNQVTNKLYDTVVQGKPLERTQPNITGVNPQTGLVKNQLDNPIYSNTDTYGKKREIDSFYIEQYYNRKQPRNELVDAFEKNLGINTSRQLTPDQNKQFTNAMNTLTTRAKDTNDMETGIFKPMDKKSFFMKIQV